ncbi:transcriptional adapter 2-alpha [Plakobranchus ocellatus]|uniref:Transcriptional adapter n=1 Tax=Plakobranchus ocellatus TaxID=259542 RepID=A0AAV4BF01_9GAST|nr:transcriptional adapter 2-alpha [Plakobranchus ocellatus]
MEAASSSDSHSGEGESEIGSTCKSCCAMLEVPWVRCAVCRPPLDLCSRCFCFGVEFGQHESDHAYTVVKFDFPLYEASWSAAEEIQLLEAVQEYGLGNWSAISGRMRTKSPEECEGHYFRCYIDNPAQPLPEFPSPENNTRSAPVIFKLSDNPPRPAENSTLWSEMGGYSAARSDFNEEYENFIELEISDMDFNEDHTDDEDELDAAELFGSKAHEREEMTNLMRDELDAAELFGSKAHEREEMTNLMRDLKLAVIDVYRNCLLERQRRKKIVRDYGLINIRKLQVIFKSHYSHNLSFDFFRPFMRLFPPMTFDKYLESLLYEKRLRTEISRLLEYRKNGITKLRSVKHFHTMRQRRENMKSQRHLLTQVLNHVNDELSCQAWLARRGVIENSSKTPVLPPLAAPRKPPPRLNIEGLPGYERLNQLEREFCSETRLVPEAYLDFSKILISECDKIGSLRLAQARTLIKIDVNKTRKLFDFLVLHGQITKSS